MESVCYELQAEGHEVFFDKEDLPPGRGYNELIRSAIENCDLFIFMISPESVAKGRYTLTELKIAAKKWPNPAGHVLPVMLVPTSFDEIPAYLKAVTVLSPEGNLTAEIAIEIADLDHSKPVEPKTIELETDLPALSYLPLEIRFEAGSDGEYPISITDSPVGTTPAQSHPFDPKALELLLQTSTTTHLGETLRFVQKEQAEVNETLQPSVDNARKIGEQLYNLLFLSPVQTCLKDSLRTINPQHGQGLRFLINTTETPDLARLPWEFLYSPLQDDFLFTDILKPVVRWLDVDQPPPSLLVKPPLRLLIAIASPSNKPGLSVGEEMAHLDEALRDLVDKGLVEIQCLEHTTLELLDSTLLKNKPHILHFIGHGEFSDNEGMIILESKTTHKAEPISGRRLSVLLRNHLASLRFVFLNSCVGASTSDKDPFGGVAQSLIQRGIPAVIAMQFPIPDQAAVSLAQHFYRYLAAGQPVDAAITSTRAFLFAKGYDVEWGAPALYMRTADGRLFDIENTFAWETVDTTPADLPFCEPEDQSDQWFGEPEEEQNANNEPSRSNVKRWLLLLLFLVLTATAAFVLIYMDKSTTGINPPPPPDKKKVPVLVEPTQTQAEIIDKAYHNALTALKRGETKEALDKLRAAKQKDRGLHFLYQHPNLKKEFVSILLVRAYSELPNGDIDLSQNIVDLLQKIDPNRFQQLQEEIFRSVQRANRIANLHTQVKLALSKGDLAIAQKIVDQLLKIAPDNTQFHQLQEQIAKRLIPLPEKIHNVAQGDSLWAIADSTYSDPTQWSLIYQANQSKIDNPDLIYLGQKLTLPILTVINETSLPQNHHRTKKGESLWKIAAEVYGDPLRWLEIFAANSHLIKNPDRIFPNQIFKIPKGLSKNKHR